MSSEIRYKLIEKLEVHGFSRALSSLAADYVIELISLENRSDICAQYLKSANVVVDTFLKEVYLGVALIKLTPREYKFLEFMMKNPGRIITRREILRNVWGPAQAESEDEYGQYISVCINSLRKHGIDIIKVKRAEGLYIELEKSI